MAVRATVMVLAIYYGTQEAASHGYGVTSDLVMVLG
jgi:hypothetical protein